MEILIKSFNRAYYLDRCLSSIYQYAKGFTKIKIVDDGTPAKYLDKIRNKYKNVEIILSKHYQSKAEALRQQKEIDGYYIPIDEWRQVVKDAEKYILVLEDDVWFTNEVDLESIKKEMDHFHIDMVKLGWQGSTKYAYNFVENKISNNLISQHPTEKLFLAKSPLMSLVFENKYKLKSILHRLNKFNNYTIQEYYELFSILMGLYNKDYWLYLWKDIDNRVSEKSQMINAIEWRKINIKNKHSICKIATESLKTTYASTATNSYRKYNTKLNINLVNYTFNELWYNNLLDSLNNMPKDFDIVYLEEIYNQLVENKVFRFDDYKKWIKEFKESAIEYGADVD